MINDNWSCRRIASNQMLLTFARIKPPGGPSHEMRAAHRRRKDSLQRIGGADLSVRRAGVLRLIDTRCGSHNSRYVNKVGSIPVGGRIVL